MFILPPHDLSLLRLDRLHNAHPRDPPQRNGCREQAGCDRQCGGFRHRSQRRGSQMKLARASRLHEDRAQIPGCTPDDRRKDAIVGSFPQKGPVQAPRTHADRPLCADLRDPRMDIRIYGIDDIQYTLSLIHI